MKRLAPLLVLAGALIAGAFLLGPAACGDDCQVKIADPIGDPYTNAEQSCWPLRPDGGCDDTGSPAICHGTTLSCPAGKRLGLGCFTRPTDAGTSQ